MQCRQLHQLSDVQAPEHQMLRVQVAHVGPRKRNPPAVASDGPASTYKRMKMDTRLEMLLDVSAAQETLSCLITLVPDEFSNPGRTWSDPGSAHYDHMRSSDALQQVLLLLCAAPHASGA